MPTVVTRHNQNQRFYACINMETPPRPQSNIPVTNEPSQAGPIVRASVSPSKKKLGAALTSMDEFNDALRERTANRREKYDYNLASVKVQMLEMERALEEEVILRVELQNKLTAECDKRIEELQQRFETIINERTLSMNQRLEDLSVRVNCLNCRIREEGERIPKDIEHKSQDLAEHLTTLQRDFVVERNDRLNRESLILKQLEEHERQIEKRFHLYASERKGMLDQLSNAIDESEKRRSEDTSILEGKVQEEIYNLHEILNMETLTRKQEDDDIIEVINKYMNQIQDSVARLSLGGLP